MSTMVPTQTPNLRSPGYEEAWEMVAGQLRSEMTRAEFETWVQPLRPLDYQRGRFNVGAFNPYARDWVERRLNGRITRILEGLFQEPVELKISVVNGFYPAPENIAHSHSIGAAAHELPLVVEQPELDLNRFLDEDSAELEGPQPQAKPIKAGESPRKLMLQRAYGSKRARTIQPERGMFVTQYFFTHWLPLVGHSAFAVILAARSMCYWNPMTGELRNTLETEIGELAKRASVSVRTVKDVLNMALVKRYFLRYTVRRTMTPNGIRTAGILLQVRMDDPLTPEDQTANDYNEDTVWYTAEFEDETEE